MTFHLSHALHAVPAPEIRKRAFIALVLASVALIGTALVLAPAVQH